jgi:hypothetical protein
MIFIGKNVSSGKSQNNIKKNKSFNQKKLPEKSQITQLNSTPDTQRLIS